MPSAVSTRTAHPFCIEVAEPKCIVNLWESHCTVLTPVMNLCIKFCIDQGNLDKQQVNSTILPRTGWIVWVVSILITGANTKTHDEDRLSLLYSTLSTNVLFSEKRRKYIWRTCVTTVCYVQPALLVHSTHYITHTVS